MSEHHSPGLLHHPDRSFASKMCLLLTGRDRNQLTFQLFVGDFTFPALMIQFREFDGWKIIWVNEVSDKLE